MPAAPRQNLTELAAELKADGVFVFTFRRRVVAISRDQLSTPQPVHPSVPGCSDTSPPSQRRRVH